MEQGALGAAGIKACRLWTGRGPQCAYSGRAGHIVSPRAQLVRDNFTLLTEIINTSTSTVLRLNLYYILPQISRAPAFVVTKTLFSSLV